MKKIINFLFKYKYVFISGLLGAICFILIYGVDILNPTNVNWILAKGGDLTQHYLGWEFFRRSPWTFPIGINSIAAYPFEFSVIFTDSIPLFAIFFKIFSNILPDQFQYLGIYGMLCYVLMGMTSTIVLKKFIKNNLIVVITSLFLIMCPVVVDRMFHHTALVSHYLIMIGFILVLYKDKFSLKQLCLFWGLLSLVCVSTHIYILLFNGIILLGYMLYEFLDKKNIKRVIFPFASFMLSGILTGWVLGAFGLPSSPFGVQALGLFSFNLNGFFNPFGFSRFIPRLPIAYDSLQDEGFAYLGLGILIASVIALLCVAVISTYKILMKKEFKIDKKLLIAIIFVSVICLITSTANAFYFGDKLLLEYSIPKFIEWVAGAFRSNGRIIWILYYIIVFGVIYILHKVFNKKFFLILIICLLGIQIYDMSNALKIKKFEVNLEYHPVFVDERWNQLFQEDFKHVIMPSTFPGNLDFMYNVSVYSLKYGKTTNRFNIAQDVLDPVVDQYLIDNFWNFSDDNLYIIDPYAYLKYNFLDMNYYILDNFYIATTRQLDYLPKVTSDEIVVETSGYSKFQFYPDRKYLIKAETPQNYIVNVIQEQEVAGCEVIIDENDIMHIYVTNRSEIIFENSGRELVKYIVTEIEEVEK